MGLKASIRILIVDDLSTMRKIIKTMLTQLGFTNTKEANDGDIALSMLEKGIELGEPFEFIISDWSMPKMSGLELVKKIRATESLKTVPFLMVTAEAEQGNVVIAVKAGVNNVIVKPFSVSIFKEKIEKIFIKK